MGEHQNIKLNHAVKTVVLTVSDTRSFDTDKGGRCMRQLLQADDVGVSDTHCTIMKDEKIAITTRVKKWSEEGIDVIITTDGIDTTQRNVTTEVVKLLLTKGIDGFGESLRYLSYVEDVGTHALLSCTVTGIVNNKSTSSVPGLTGVTKLVLGKLIKPELSHPIHKLTK